MRQAVIGVESQFRGIGIGSAGHQQVLIEIFSIVTEAGSTLDEGPAIAAHAHLAAGKRRSPAIAGRGFQQGDFRSCTRSLDCRAGTTGAETDDDDIGIEVPMVRPIDGQ